MLINDDQATTLDFVVLELTTLNARPTLFRLKHLSNSHQEYSSRLESAVNGDRDALLYLLLEVQRPLGRFVRNQLRSTPTAQIGDDDVMQEIFIRAFRDIKGLDAKDEAGFLAWLKRLASNQIVDIVRRRRAIKRGGEKVRVDGRANAFGSCALDLIALISDEKGGTPSQFAARREAIEAMTVALANLPGDQQRAIRLHFFERLSLDETAKRMGRSWGSVRGLIQRAKASLRTSMHKSVIWLSKKG